MVVGKGKRGRSFRDASMPTLAQTDHRRSRPTVLLHSHVFSGPSSDPFPCKMIATEQPDRGADLNNHATELVERSPLRPSSAVDSGPAPANADPVDTDALHSAL